MGLRRQHAAKVVEIRREYVKGFGLFGAGQEPTTKAYITEKHEYFERQRARFSDLLGRLPVEAERYRLQNQSLPGHPYESCRYMGPA